MGWTYTNKRSYETVDEFFERELLGGNLKPVGKGALVHFHEYYRAVLNEKTNEVFCLVCLVDCKGDKDFNFGFKDMDDTCGPTVYNCPKRILDVLSKTNNEWSNAWREKCRQRLDKRSSSNKIKDGAIIRFNRTIEFTNGAKADTFVLCSDKGYGRRRARKYFAIYENGIQHGRYRITNWKDWEFDVVGNVA